MLVLSIAAYAVSMPLAQRPRTQKPQKKTETTSQKQSKPNAIKAQPIIANDDTIPRFSSSFSLENTEKQLH